eukprot:4440570-Pyramimonas_sp.AAC.1
MAARFLREVGGFSQAAQPGMSLIPGSSGAVDLGRAALHFVCRKIDAVALCLRCARGWMTLYSAFGPGFGPGLARDQVADCSNIGHHLVFLGAGRETQGLLLVSKASACRLRRGQVKSSRPKQASRGVGAARRLTRLGKLAKGNRL